MVTQVPLVVTAVTLSSSMSLLRNPDDDVLRQAKKFQKIKSKNFLLFDMGLCLAICQCSGPCKVLEQHNFMTFWSMITAAGHNCHHSLRYTDEQPVTCQWAQPCLCAHHLLSELWPFYQLPSGHPLAQSREGGSIQVCCTLYTAHCTLHTVHWTLYTAHCTLYTVHCTIHTVHFTLYTADYKLQCTHYALYTTL